MDTARKQNLREKLKQKWADADAIARTVLKGLYSKHQVFSFRQELDGDDGLYGRLLTILSHEGARVSDDLANEAAERMRSALREHRGEVREKIADHNERVEKRSRAKLRIHEPAELCTDPMDQLRLAIWYISKVGDAELAVKIVRLAADAAKKL